VKVVSGDGNRESHSPRAQLDPDAAVESEVKVPKATDVLGRGANGKQVILQRFRKPNETASLQILGKNRRIVAAWSSAEG
jgi:hypothetical protein